MKQLVYDLIAPLMRRVGTMGGTAALTYGATADQSVAVETALAFLGGVILDLTASAVARRFR